MEECRREDNITADLTEIGVNTRNCIDSAKDVDSPREYGIEPAAYMSHIEIEIYDLLPQGLKLCPGPWAANFLIVHRVIFPCSLGLP